MRKLVVLFAILLAGSLSLGSCAAPAAVPAGEAPGITQTTGEKMENLNGSSWLLSDLNGAAPVADSAPTLAFSAEGRVSGSTGCNRYMGGYTSDDASISFGQMAGTKMMCAPELMDQETMFFDLMGRVTSSTLADDTLTLTADDGATLLFMRG